MFVVIAASCVWRAIEYRHTKLRQVVEEQSLPTFVVMCRASRIMAQDSPD